MNRKCICMFIIPTLLLGGSCGHKQLPTAPDYIYTEGTPVLSNTIPEMYTDYYVTSSEVYYINVSDREPWQGITYTKGNYIGKVLFNTESRELRSIQPGSSNVLPIGSDIYETNEDRTIILVNVDNRLIPYLKMVEG